MSVENASTRRKQIVDEIGEAGINHPSLLEQEFTESQLHAVEFSRLAQPALHSGYRWVSIATDYKKENVFAGDFIKLLTELRNIWMKKVMEINGKLLNRLLDTRNQRIPQDRNPKTRIGRLGPDFFFQGTGSLFPKRLNTGKILNWSTCVVAGDAKLIKGKDASFGQLGTYAEQVFAAQENRRFVHTFYANNSYLVWCTFDRGGAVQGDPVYYHRYPWTLCTLVMHLFFHEKDHGLDTSIYYEGSLTFIRTTPPPGPISNAACEETSPRIPNATYVVRRTLFHCTGIRGNGSIYWLAQCHEAVEGPRGDDQEKNWYIIKDTWVVNGCERERRIYDQINSVLTDGTGQGSSSENILFEGQGITPLLFTHNVFFDDKLDSVSTNRPLGVNTQPEDNRVHTRAVFRVTAGAKLLDQFGSTMELLVAVRDAVKGHRKLNSHHVLHKNITPYRTLVQPDAREGDRGVLLDFGSVATPRNGARNSLAFCSRAVCKAVALGRVYTPSHFDDLESFFYVLCYLVVCYPATGSLKPSRIPETVSYWFSATGGWASKTALISDLTLHFSVDDSFQPPVPKLMMGLHRFFRKYHSKATSLEIPWCPEPDEGYEEFMCLLNDAIDELKKYESGAGLQTNLNFS